MYNYDQANSQKAKSVLLACPALQKVTAELSVRPSYLDIYQTIFSNENNKPMFFSTTEHVNNFIINNLNFWAFGKKLFARPCPLTPRHGFVDSRIIKSHADLIALFEEIKSADPKGELILTEFIANATASAVLTTSGILSIGPNHDGATSGYKSISIPVKPQNLPTEIMKLAGLKEDENAFLESVFPLNKNKDEVPFQITQIRGGPAVKQVADFIPEKTKVKEVINPHKDLLAWEHMVKDLAPGTVVYGLGHSLASHAAIHCIINNIPFVTSFCPKIGSTIEPVSEKAAPLDRNMFLRGVHASLKKVYSLDVMLHLSASILHNWAFIRNSDHASWLLGVAASYMCQVLLALCYGEYRHAKLNKLKLKTLSMGMGRNEVYKDVIDPAKFRFYMSKSIKVSRGFIVKDNFTGKEFGGIKWARATNMSIKIWNSIVNIQNKTINDVSVNRLIANINRATNLVHNGGWLFNKFSTPEKLSKISEQPNQTMFELSDFIFDIHKEYKSIDTKLVGMKKLTPINLRKKK